MYGKLLNISYDNSADVLYISMGHHSPDRYEEDKDGLVWRYDVHGTPYGVTIMDFNECWLNRKNHLIKRIASILKISKEEIFI